MHSRLPGERPLPLRMSGMPLASAESAMRCTASSNANWTTDTCTPCSSAYSCTPRRLLELPGLREKVTSSAHEAQSTRSSRDLHRGNAQLLGHDLRCDRADSDRDGHIAQHRHEHECSTPTARAICIAPTQTHSAASFTAICNFQHTNAQHGGAPAAQRCSARTFAAGAAPQRATWTGRGTILAANRTTTSTTLSHAQI